MIADHHWYFWLYWVIALAWTLIQCISGWVYGTYEFEKHKADNSNSGDNRWAKAFHSNKWYTVVAYKLHHALIYGSCSAVGFGLVYADVWLLKQIKVSDASAGTGAIVIAFAVVGVAGISGMLAKLLYKADKLPGM